MSKLLSSAMQIWYSKRTLKTSTFWSIRRFSGLAFLLSLLCAFSSCNFGADGVPNQSSAQTEQALGTLCRIELFADGKPELYSRLFARLREIENMMSPALEDSELSRINRMAGIEAVPASPELFSVLERALFFAEVSDGAFDPTVGPLVRLWGGENPRVPSAEELEAALALINWREVDLNPATSSVFLRRAGMELDLGAIAKGFAADDLAQMLKETGVKAAIIDLGGNIYLYGAKPGRSYEANKAKNTAGAAEPWRVGVQNPLKDERGAYTGYLEIKGRPAGNGSSAFGFSVVTSGVYERFFIENGKRYHHILDTGTGFPVENGLLSVTVTASSSMDADALSTAVFALGWEKGRALAEAHGAGALFIFSDKTIRGAGGILDMWTLTGESFTIEAFPKAAGF